MLSLIRLSENKYIHKMTLHTQHIMLLIFQVLGSLWYLLTVDRQTTCWKEACKREESCNIRYLDCSHLEEKGYQDWVKTTQVFTNCNASNSSITFQFGMFEPALQNESPSKGFIIKYFYSFWWGLQNLRYI